jgi:hypothetical protein
VLISRPAEAASWSVASVGALIILCVATMTSADAGNIDRWSCVGGWRDFNCVEQSGPAGDPYVRLVPEPLGDGDRQRLQARDQKWLTRCHPTVEHDRYGVARYYYSAPGCEFGIGAD